MRNFLPKQLRKPAPNVRRPALEAARRQVQMHLPEDPVAHRSEQPTIKSDQRTMYAETLDPTA